MIKFLKNNSIAIIIVTIFLAIYGVVALLTIPKEAQPSIDLPYYYISFSYLGADPSSIEEQIVIPLEQRIKSISEVKNITASSYYNFGTILVEFELSKSDAEATNDLKSVIDQVYSTLPADVNYPILKRIDIADSPVFSFSVAGPMPTQVLYEEVSELEDALKSVPGVSDVSIIGKPSKEIQLLFDMQKLGTLNLDFSMVIAQLRSSFVKFPVDKKIIDGNLYSFEVINYETNLTGLLQNISNYDIINIQGKTIKVSDVAQVYIGYKNQDKKSFIVTDVNSLEGRNALAFHVKKSPGYSLGPLVEAVKEVTLEYQKAHPNIEFIETLSQEESIKKTYGTFIQNFWQTGLLVFFVILLFLGARSSFVIFFAFFVVYLSDFIYLKTIGYSFNNIVSFSLILVLGIMIDNLIVITQGIVTGLQEHAGDIRKAIGYSLRIYGKPVIFGTLTTIAVFAPLYFGLSGIMGEYLRSMPVTVISNLVISLIVTLVILPVIASLLFKSGKVFVPRASLSFLQRLGNKVARIVKAQNASKGKSFGMIALFITGFIAAVSLMPLGIVKFSFMGNMDSNNMWMNLRYDPGLSLEDNQKYTAQVAQATMKYFQTELSGMVQEISIDLGQGYSLEGGGAAGANVSSFTIRLIDSEDRKGTSYEFVEKTQQELVQALQQEYAFIREIEVFTVQAGGGGGKPVKFNIVGEDYQEINTYAQDILPEIKKIPGIFNVSISIDYTNGKIAYVLDENKVKELGANSMSVVMNMLALQNSEYKSNGILINEFSEFGTEVLPLRASLNSDIPIEQTRIGNYTLSQIIKRQKLSPEINAINRDNGKRSISIQADKLDAAALSDITTAIADVIDQHPLPIGLEYTSGGDIQQLDQSTQDMSSAMMIGLLLMLIVLIIQFNNIKYGLLIVLSVTFTFGGIILILALTGFDLTFPGMIAIFGVFGVGVNQMLILLEDYKYFHQEENLSIADAFQRSIQERFVPIFLTNATTIIGLSILAFRDELFGSMAIAFIGGLFASVFIGLFFLPALMNLVSRKYYKQGKNNNEKGKIDSNDVKEDFDEEVFQPLEVAPETIQD